MEKPKLRDSNKYAGDFYELGKLPENAIMQIGESIIYLVAIGRKDISGNDWGDIFAEAIDGEHLVKPIGIVDVCKDKSGWSLKTVKNNDPLSCRQVRLISGRCSPDYSYGILDPHEDIQKTGEAVLAIWNSRVDIAFSHYYPCRIGVLIRNEKLNLFSYFEEVLEHYKLNDFIWKENKNGNLEGYYKNSNEKKFVWQPHGSQLTIITEVSSKRQSFILHLPEIINRKKILQSIGYNKSWIEIL